MPIDVHAHYVPPALIHALQSRAADFGMSLDGDVATCNCAIHFDYGLKLRPFFPKLVEAEEKRLTSMERQGIDRQVLSTWGDIFGYRLPSAQAVEWHRFLNENMARVCEKRSDRFSFLASVPLPHAGRAAEELHHAVSSLGAVGAVVAASADGKNLGELDLDEFWQAAVDLNVGVFIHPVQPQPEPRARKFGLVQSAQYTYDTTLCVGSLIFAGVLDRFPTLRMLLSHGGGGFPYLSGRFDCMHERMDRVVQGDVAAQKPSNYLKRFFYDTILHDPDALRFLAKKVTIQQIVLGTDDSFPPADRDPLASVAAAGFDDDDRDAIYETNARRLFPLLGRL